MDAGRAALAVAAIAATITVSLAAAQADDDVFVQIAQVRKATVHFRAIDAAEAAGYARFQDCVDEPGQGAMGVHFVHGTHVGDTVIDALRPEALMFEPDRHGRMKLVGVEYIVFQEAWDAENAVPPALFGQPFHLVGIPNRYGIPAFYALHAWVWRHNPSGTFNDWNPHVSCDALRASVVPAPVPHRH